MFMLPKASVSGRAIFKKKVVRAFAAVRSEAELVVREGTDRYQPPLRVRRRAHNLKSVDRR